MAQAPSVRLAADIGGTFTDVVLVVGSRQFAVKVLTTPREPEQAVVDGAEQLLSKAGLAFADIGVFVHGTTLATNAIIERKGARTALIATEGFRDVIEIADESRFDQYDINIVKPEPLTPRNLRFTVPERMDVHGVVRLVLDEAAVRAVALEIAEAGVEAVAVALIHAYANGAHEERIGAILSELCPNIEVTLASRVCPEAREYERTSTAIANAYVQPLMARYLRRLEAAFSARGYRRDIHLMTSGGNLATLDTAVRYPIRLVESGPAGGAILAGQLAAERGEGAILSFDMGGTTAKICLIENGRPLKGRLFEIDRRSRFRKGSGLPVRIPVIEMVEIGAGGGSIAAVDGLGRLRAGPESAGSEPGPACYGRGGAAATVTDADVVLGRIDPDRFAGGTIGLDAARAAAAIQAAVAGPLRLELLSAAAAVDEIVNETMANAARVHAVERGVAVMDRTMVAFGGAAPLHACRLAEKLGIRRIIVPPDAGVGSAIGFLKAPAAYELVRSRYLRLDRFDADAVNTLLDAMSAEAGLHAAAAAGGRPLNEIRTAFMRYAGQGHEIPVSLPDGPLSEANVPALRQAFEAQYARLFARIIPAALIEVMAWAVTVSTPDEAPPMLPAPPLAAAAPEPSGRRAVFDHRAGRHADVPVFDRVALQPGMTLPGPLLVREDGTTTYVTNTFTLTVDAGYALVLTANGAIPP